MSAYKDNDSQEKKGNPHPSRNANIEHYNKEIQKIRILNEKLDPSLFEGIDPIKYPWTLLEPFVRIKIHKSVLNDEYKKIGIMNLSLREKGLPEMDEYIIMEHNYIEFFYGKNGEVPRPCYNLNFHQTSEIFQKELYIILSNFEKRKFIKVIQKLFLPVLNSND